MTVEKDRYKTQEKLWKIDDEQLATPEHDILVLQLLDKTIYPKIGIFEPIERIWSEEPILTQNRFIVGYWDIVAATEYNPERYGSGEDGYLFYHIEVKPKILSFGKVLRQLKTYWEYQNRDVYLYTPDRKFDAAFESQGIKMIHPPF
jgi:hypothetical protein